MSIFGRYKKTVNLTPIILSETLSMVSHIGDSVKDIEAELYELFMADGDIETHSKVIVDNEEHMYEVRSKNKLLGVHEVNYNKVNLQIKLHIIQTFTKSTYITVEDAVKKNVFSDNRTIDGAIEDIGPYYIYKTKLRNMNTTNMFESICTLVKEDIAEVMKCMNFINDRARYSKLAYGAYIPKDKIAECIYHTILNTIVCSLDSFSDTDTIIHITNYQDCKTPDSEYSLSNLGTAMSSLLTLDSKIDMIINGISKKELRRILDHEVGFNAHITDFLIWKIVEESLEVVLCETSDDRECEIGDLYLLLTAFALSERLSLIEYWNKVIEYTSTITMDEPLWSMMNGEGCCSLTDDIIISMVKKSIVKMYDKAHTLYHD